MSKVLDNLYVGSLVTSRDAKFFDIAGITHVVIAALGLKAEFTHKASYQRLDVNDTEKDDILGYFLPAIKFIDEAIFLRRGKVLVHCWGGRSRSTTIVCAYVMIRCRINAEEAIKFVKKKHYDTFPNPGFISQLLDFEEILMAYFKELHPSFEEFDEIDFDLLRSKIESNSFSIKRARIEEFPQKRVG